MIAYTANRLLTLIPTLLAASFLVFMFVRLIPGDPAAILLGDSATPEDIAALTRELGLDEPLWRQYALWLGNVARGDMGTSVFFGQPVFDRDRGRSRDFHPFGMHDDGVDCSLRSSDRRGVGGQARKLG